MRLLHILSKRTLHKIITFASIGAFILASVPFSPTTNTYAAESQCDEAFYSSNDVLFYNPCAKKCGGSTTGATAEVSSVHGKNNGEKIFNFWVDAGMTAQQSAGITGSMQNEGGFSPFRQETTQSWPAGGWGIAQFTGGQRDAATAFVQNVVGAGVFSQYYSDAFGGAVIESNGFVPDGIPTDVNDKFLLGQLNYLLQHVKQLVPNDTRTSLLKDDYGQSIPSGVTLYDYLKTVVQAGDAAIAWTYLYEFPGDIKNTSSKRANSAADILKLYSAGGAVSASCGGDLTAGGMTLDQGVKFMNAYKSDPSNVQYIGGAGQDCAGGPLSNCVSFSMYFVNKYTNLKSSASPGNGSTVVANLISQNPTAQNGHSPRPYAIFSTPSGSQMCGDVKCGHTGVILGVDTTGGKVIVGEAACGGDASWDTAREYPLSQFDSNNYTYIYTDGLLKGAVQ